MASDDYADRVWSGDRTTVEEAQARFHTDPKKYLVEFAVGLYSFRHDDKCADELIRLRPLLLAAATEMIGTLFVGTQSDEERFANRADTISTHLEWMGRQPGFTHSERSDLLRIAGSLAMQGLRVIKVTFLSTENKHTEPLLRLTMARIMLGNDAERDAGVRELHFVSRYASMIPDKNQRTRIYRKLGMLYSMSGDPIRGIFWGVRACLVPGTPLAVRAKSLAALFGNDQ